MKQLVTVIAAALVFIATASADSSKRYERMIHQAFDRYGIGNTMACIANRESRMVPTAANYHDSNGGSYGLFQINGVHRHYGESTVSFMRRMLDPYENVQTALGLYLSRDSNGVPHPSLAPWGGGC